ncbi:hypothetical protein NBH00_02390 [Paraconexibacter antarcticus]|uniref:Uncharacterized protein n=1 Tax=Paraconexibacter antarcticus TaxID=2949664 RepID=A0ABY5DWL1_9ACTN|nr:hypothetical protein [Paraconexibacter antarcticus]UTI65067.1 hypothetical protein NBH00_02390 [Paraconexibacter antarcticus]
MSFLSKRTGAPLAVLAAAAVPLLAPAASNAAIAGALAPNSTLAPDLVSATVTANTASGSTVKFCFDKTLGSIPAANAFSINTYKNVASGGNTAAVNGTQCVDVKFNGVADTTTFTTGTVAGGSVVNASTGTRNFADSTALIGPSATSNGTRGRTTAPDLTGVTFAGSQVSYTFDEALAAIPDPTQFTLLGANGIQSAQGLPAPAVTTLSADRKTVTVTMNAAPTVVANSVRALYSGVGGTVVSQYDGDPAPLESAALAGGTGGTTLPDPTSATVVGDGSTGQVDVVFDDTVTGTTVGGVPGPVAPGGFSILLSDGRTIPADGATLLGTNTVRLGAIPAGVNFNRGEFIVGVIAAAGAVTGPAGASTPANVPAGGNTGAFATGFTTGPDAVATTFNGATNSAVVTLDQRYATAVPGGFFTIDNTGTANAAPATSLSFGSTAVPGRTTVTAQFTSIAGARALLINAGALATSLASPFGPANTNITQALAPSASTAG